MKETKDILKYLKQKYLDTVGKLSIYEGKQKILRFSSHIFKEKIGKFLDVKRLLIYKTQLKYFFYQFYVFTRKKL